MLTVTEPLTYAEGAPRSFYRDVFFATAFHDDDATARLDRHQLEMSVELAARAGTPVTTLADGAEVEYRVHPNSTLGTGGEFDPPLWLVDKFSTAVRGGRPFGDILMPMLLPEGCSSVHTPRIVTGTLTAGQAGDGTATTQQDFTTSDASSNVITISGQSLLSQQLFDQSPIGIDTAVFKDLAADYDTKMEFQLLYGSTGGTQLAGQFLGLKNVPGVPAANIVVGTTGTTIALLWPLLGQVAANVGNNRFLPPQAWLMAPRRWFWIASSVDSSNRPISSPGASGPHIAEMPMAGGSAAFGPILGVPAYLDGTIPAGGSADDVFAVRPSDMFLWESEPKTIVAVNPSGANLQVLVSMHKYAAFIPQRYPSGIGMLSGLPQPSGF